MRSEPSLLLRFMQRQLFPSPRTVAAQLCASLERLADPAGAKRALTYFREHVEVLGISTPDIRRLVREAHRAVARPWGLREAMEACDLLLRDRRLEVKGAAIALLGRFSRAFEASMFPAVASWLTSNLCDSWATVDALCGEVLSPLFARHPALLARTWRWTASRNRWVRRASLASLVRMARRGERLHYVYSVALRLVGDEHDLVQKACGWLLREAGKTDARRLDAFLRRHGPKIRRTTLRYAIERFPAAKRRELLDSTRGAARPSAKLDPPSRRSSPDR